MNIKQLLGAKGIHYLVTRFGPRKLRSIAFDEKYRSGEWDFNSNSEVDLAVAIQRYLRKGDLLIMGCGGASVLEGLEGSGLRSALGIDLSEEAVRIASRFASDKISFKVADMVTFECPRPYDIILFSESLYYVPATDQVDLLLRLSLYLKTGGVFIVTFAQAKRYVNLLERIREAFTVIEDHSFPNSTRHLIIFSASIRLS